MAELVVINIAKSLLEQLSSLVKDEIKLWFKSKTELEKLENTITTIKYVLHDAEDKGAKNAAVKGWLLRLRDEMYKTDDMFDTISTRALQKRVMSGNKLTKEMRLFFSESNQLAFTVRTAHRVKEFRKRLDAIAKDIQQFGFIRSTNEDERWCTKRNRETHSFVPEDGVIGRDKDKEEILKMLLAATDVEERVSVIAVFGIGGLGKTALAKEVYNAKEIEEFFDLQLWACVNDFSNLNEALDRIVASGTEERPIGLHLDRLKDKLWRRIHGKKFFLVLDDVWDNTREQWLSLKDLLDAGERGSKVLLTTRLMSVSNNLSTVRPYALGELSDEHAWLLFKKMAFRGNQDVESQEKEELGRRIMKKCPNVPLAIRTIACFLYGKNKKQWMSFLDNEKMKVVSDAENAIMQTLRISYTDLPPPLKHCFAYCSLFPKDYEFDKTTLIHLWMAQGLLDTSSETQCLEDVGESYFFFLIERCFFQDVMVNGEGNIVSCEMHDLFHDLAIEIAGKECLQIMKLDDLNGKAPRHLLVGDINSSPLQGKGTRSLVSLVAGVVERSVLDGLFMHLTCLRTLSLRHLDVEEIPSSIGKLVHLRYIDLMRSEKLIKLPDALCKLQNLLVLRLGDCSNLIKLPDCLQKLINLRYLEIKGCDKLDHIPSGLKEMTSLVMLDRLVVNKDHGGLRFLKCLNNLTGCIDIELPGGEWKDCVADAEESMLRNKIRLSKLVISWGDPTEEEDMLVADPILDKLQPPSSIDHLCVTNFVGVKFSNWLSCLKNLVEIFLRNCSRCAELPNLRELFHLKTLQLDNFPLLEYLENENHDNSKSFFTSLEILLVYSMPMLKGWWRPLGEGVHIAHQLWFPKLRNLSVSDCPELTQLPLCPTVESLSLSDVNVNLLRQLLQRAPETESNVTLLPSSSSHHSCGKLWSLMLHKIKDLAFMPDEIVQMSTVRQLYIRDCPNFKRHSVFYLQQHLHALEAFTFGGLSQESNGTELFVDENQESNGVPWMSLTRLEILDFEFGRDPQGAHLFKGIHHLTSLEFLSIHKDLPHDNYSQWKAPPNLKELHLSYMEEVAYLNSAFLQLKKLQQLVFNDCNVDEHELDKLPWADLKSLTSLYFGAMDMMKSLPDNCRHLPALEELDILACPELTSLPDWVSHLTSLAIINCPALIDKCRKPVGSCWPLIQSIPYLQLITSYQRTPQFSDSLDVMTYSKFNQRNR